MDFFSLLEGDRKIIMGEMSQSRPCICQCWLELEGLIFFDGDALCVAPPLFVCLSLPLFV